MGDGEVTKATASTSGGIPAEIGVSGLVRTGGYVQEEYLAELRGTHGIKCYKQMRDNDPIAGALIFAITSLMRQIKWSTKAFDDSQEAEDKARFLAECMDDMSMSWADVISEVCSMFVFGWSILEPLYKKRMGDQPEDGDVPSSKYDDGRIGWRKMPLRAQETLVRWEFDDNGGLQGMVQSSRAKGEVTIPITSALLFRTQTYKNNPEGRSIFRNAYRPWFFKTRIEEIEAIGIERDLAGLPIMWLPAEYLDPDAPDKIKNAAKAYETLVQNVRRDKQEGMCLPSIYDDDGNKLLNFELMSSGGARTFDTDTIISRYAMHIALTALADWLLLGHETVGSFALSASKTNLFGVVLGAWKDTILTVFNSYAVPRLFRMNGFPVKDLPQIVAEDIESPDIMAIGAFLSALTSSGLQVFPNNDLVKRLFQMANLPEPSEDQLQAYEDAARIQQEAAMQAAQGTTAQEDQQIADLGAV